jgi:diacylglycerol kinase family enzyme
MRPAFILNGASAHAQRARALIARISQELGQTPEVVVTERGDDLPRLASRAAQAGNDAVVAGGGDGTVNAVAGAVIGTSAALGVLPIGTLNHFAKDAGIPLDLEAAIRNAFTGEVTRVDVGEVNGRVFVNNAGIGIYPHFVRQREEQQRHGYEKWVAFIIAIKSIVRRYARLRVRLHLGEADALARVAPFLFVGNNRYEINGLRIGTRPSLHSGRLWVCMPPRSGRLDLIGMATRAWLGRLTDNQLHAVEVEQIEVDPQTRWANVSTDGEVGMLEAPLHFRTRPGALGVVVPVKGAPKP